MMHPKINIITIPVKDVSVSAEFYRKVFALPEDEISSGDDHVAFFMEGDISLVLYERFSFAEMTGQYEGDLSIPGVIFSHTANDAKEVDSILLSVLNAGGTILKEGSTNDWGYTGLFKDMDGYTWEIMSWVETGYF